MTRMVVAGLVAVVGWAAGAGAAEPAGRYAVVVNKDVAAGPWGKVVRFLETKHGAKTFPYDRSPEDVRRDVGAYHPRHVCFVCAPTEDFPAFALVANKFCRALDDDPYVDAIWGILTGFDEDHALELARAEPVVIRRAFTKTLGPWLNWVPEGDYVTEWTRDRGELGSKKAGEDFAVKSGGPTTDADDARVEKAREPALAETLDIRPTGDEGVVRMTYKVRVNYVGEGNKRTSEKFGGWRVFCYLLPYQVTDVRVEKTDFSKVVCPGETLIWDAGKGLKVGDERSVTFTARRVKD
jgi:hypothetical protein